MNEKKFNSFEEEEQNSEINILELGEKLWKQRKKIIIWSCIGAVLGLIVAFGTPKEYSAIVKVAPETNNSRISGGLGALASFAGITSQYDTPDAVYPELYPDVVHSIPFITSLFNVKVELKDGGEQITVRQYIEKDLKSPWWSFYKTWISKATSIFKPKEKVKANHQLDNSRLTRNEAKLVARLRGRVGVEVDKKTGVITASARMQDPVVAAMLVDSVVTRLQNYITEYRTNKAREDLAFALTLNEEAKENYYRAQQRFADYLDHNQFVVYHSAQIERDRLENEATLTFNLYNQTAQQVQKAQAMVQETTPVYVIVEPATAPVEANRPGRMTILLMYTFMGFAACCVWILYGKPMWDKFRASRSKKDDAA